MGLGLPWSPVGPGDRLRPIPLLGRLKPTVGVLVPLSSPRAAAAAARARQPSFFAKPANIVGRASPGLEVVRSKPLVTVVAGAGFDAGRDEVAGLLGASTPVVRRHVLLPTGAAGPGDLRKTSSSDQICGAKRPNFNSRGKRR